MAETSTNDDDYLNAFEFVTHLPPEMRACRGGRSHNFLDGTQLSGGVNNGIVHTETQCARGCQVVKVEDWILARGHYVQRPHYRYPPPYLIKEKTHGPIRAEDLGAATRVVRYYEQMDLPIPKPAKPPRKRRSA